MNDVIIKAENLGKKYVIGHQSQRGGYTAFRDVVMANARGLWHKTTDLVKGKPVIQGDMTEEVWALKNVSFEIQRGETVGIIGRNGAGKSTLLKILSRITEPTTGRVTIRGRVASLLEVGTGFHPELTGRENIFLNGTILGMRRNEIKQKFDEIVAFAEVEKYLDTPVKRYSSGMYVRLAFAVAAHLDPEILVVDEVLAVGDAQFQRKCLGKMGEVAQGGRTVLFVSHNMAAIQSLCKQAYLLDQGSGVCFGAACNVLAEYMKKVSPLAAIPLIERSDRNGDGRVRMVSISIDNGAGGSHIQCSDALHIKIGYVSDRPLDNASFIIGIYDQFNQPLFFLDSRAAGWLPGALPASGTVSCITSPVNITPGPCMVNIACMIGGTMADHVKHVYRLEIEADDFYGTGKLPERQNALCLLKQNWEAREGSHNYISIGGIKACV
jgi:lipopolysaccharide transport system ATP-binding protein